ncbi:MAG: HAD family hydrolase [Tepidiformaceae bacterium]
MSFPAKRPLVFLDDGGVMNDNAIRAPQWRRLLGEVMPQFLGGTPEQWAEANRVQFPRLWADLEPRLAEFGSQADYQREYDLRWLDLMCSYIGIETPQEDRARMIADEATRYISMRLHCEYPDAVDAIRSLHRASFELHTASGTRSWELESYLQGMGVRDCLGTLFGPDLVDVMKGSPEYYRRIFDKVGIDPASAVILDDSPKACAWAEQAGATTLRIDRTAKVTIPEIMPDFASAAQLLITRYP